MHHMRMGFNSDQERTDVCKQELIVAETCISFNLNNTHIILSQYQQYFVYIILTKTAL